MEGAKVERSARLRGLQPEGSIPMAHCDEKQFVAPRWVEEPCAKIAILI